MINAQIFNLGLAMVLALLLSKTAAGQKKEKLENLMDGYYSSGLFNGSVLVTENDKVLLRKAYGYSNFQRKVLNKEGTRHMIYSVTKSFTAMIILKLVENGSLSLDDRLSSYFPTIPNADKISIEHLLTHTSGIYAYNNDGSMPVGSENAMVEFLSRSKPDFSPGENWRYCNTGYFLLGLIIERLTKEPYEEMVSRYILKPLKMTNSGFDTLNKRNSAVSTGYKYSWKDHFKAQEPYDYTELYAAGGMYSTVDDLLKFHNAMQQNRIIGKEATKKAYTVYKKNYGYGWFIEKKGNHEIISHSGGAAGYRSNLIRIPEKNICIVVLCNTEDTDIEGIKKQLLNLIFDQPYHQPKPLTTSSGVLQQLEGVYDFQGKMKLYVTLDNGKLQVTPSRQSSSFLIPEHDFLYYVDKIDGTIEFRRNTEGVVDSLVLVQKGERYSAPKISFNWGITGSATPNAWDGPDIKLKPDPDKPGRWYLKNVMLNTGEIKLRVNNDWTIGYGGSKDGKCLERGGNNIKVTEGIYDLVWDMRDTNCPNLLLRASE